MKKLYSMSRKHTPPSIWKNLRRRRRQVRRRWLTKLWKEIERSLNHESRS